MFLGLCLICVTLAGWAAVAATTRPADDLSRRRDVQRRSRQLVRNPDRVNYLDVENLLLSGSIPSAAVLRVMERATARRLGARTMWRWAATHGVQQLVTVVDAGVAEDALLEHLDAGSAPDWEALALFARLANDTVPAGMPVDELVDLDAVPATNDLAFPGDLESWSTPSLDDVDLEQFDRLPPIAGPGLSSYRPTRPRDPGEDDWRRSA